MLPKASGLVTGAFVLLPLLVAAGFVLGCEWAGRRLGQDIAVRRRRAVRLSAAVLAWLLVTAGIAASGALRWFDATVPHLRSCRSPQASWALPSPARPWGRCSFAACRSGR